MDLRTQDKIFPTAEPANLRPVRSFVLRGGRLTEGQKRAWDELWPYYGIDSGPGLLDFSDLFGNQNPVILDIGFGNGESTWQMARASAAENILGVEVHPPGVGHLLLKLQEHQLENVRIVCTDAVELLQTRVRDDSLAGVRLYFPDPWPKKRHYKRRIVQAGFIALLRQKIKPSGTLHLASDWTPYAEDMLQLLTKSTGLENCSPSGAYCARPEWRPRTKYEVRGQKLGHPVHDLLFRVTG